MNRAAELTSMTTWAVEPETLELVKVIPSIGMPLAEMPVLLMAMRGPPQPILADDHSPAKAGASGS
ncbi:hypothetical protein J2Y55_002736 [Bosea sp. BE125]|uniref:hypothetical protein n=1 Tax=Bosea sp. BE125 TaxID=2817909 RepID=UPI0028672E02|nr:hypothetical protein [Bosea sp. BE125]MDR6871723.1 hypothetical protein [Bosea sp. BE125]